MNVFKKRYRDTGFQVVFALYLDKSIYRITPKPQDKIIYTDITFDQNSVYDSDGNKKRISFQNILIQVYYLIN